MIFLLIKKTKTLNIREYKLFILFYLDYKFDAFESISSARFNISDSSLLYLIFFEFDLGGD